VAADAVTTAAVADVAPPSCSSENAARLASACEAWNKEKEQSKKGCV